MMRRIAEFVVGVLALLVGSAASARDVTGLSVANGMVTVSFDAGSEGDSHVLYYVWSTDGIDKGTSLADWPNAYRVDRVADDATSYEFALPTAAFLTGQYACRAMLATSAKAYDYFIEGVKSTKSTNCFVNTSFKPVGGKTSVTIDFKLTASTTQQYIFGVNKTYSLCAYVNGSGDTGKWAFSSNNGGGSWSNPTTLEATTERTQITLDTTAVVNGTNASVFTVTTPSATASRTSFEAHTATASYGLSLFGRSTSNTAIDKQCGATIYSCIITNNGVCVRDFHPAVSNGVAGLYDTVNNKFYPSGGKTALTAVGGRVVGGIEDGDTVVGDSALWSQAIPDYTTPMPFVETASLTFPAGGSKRGPAPLTLSGENDWGGAFTVYEGTLVADFGEGLAATDNLILKGGIYCPLTANTFTGTFGTGGGQVSVAADATETGFSAYGHPLTVRYGNDATVPFVTSNDVYSLTTLILNDAYATDTLTFENGIDSGSNVVEFAVEGTAVVKGAVTNDRSFVRSGNGTLLLDGTNNLRVVTIKGNGTTLVTNTAFKAVGWTTVTNNAQVVFSNTTVNCAGLTSHGGTHVTFLGGSVTSSGSWYPGNRITGKTGTFVLDGTTVSLGSNYLYPGYYSSGSNYGTGDVIVTNDAQLSMGYLHGRHGTIRQYSGTVKVTKSDTGSLRLGCHGNGTFSYYLYGGTLDRTQATKGNGFHLGILTSKGSPTGNLFIYGGEAIMRCQYGYLGRYKTGGHSDKTSGTDTGNIYVRGGTFKMPYNGAILYVGYQGKGSMEVSNGGWAEVSGVVCALPNNSVLHGRSGTVNVLTNGTLKVRRLYSACTNDTSTLVLDGGTLIANTSAATTNFLHGFTAASVGVGGATVDTAGFNLTFAQDFAARAGQTWDVDGTSAADLDVAPALTKIGAGTLTLHGTNTYLCATCVSNGTLAVTDALSLPTTTTLRVATGATVDLSEKAHTVANLMGSGVVTNGSLTVTGTVWPGYPDKGTLTVTDGTLTPAKLAFELDDNGTCGRLDVGGTLDLSGAEIVVDNALAATGKGVLTLATASSITGTPVFNQSDVVLVTKSNALRIYVGRIGTILSIR
ncbi:MAG: autotransporter-associated beta strand repeat-containing protein [Kiritimatiellae bacterium]|nr:autotransporter-associated beta strand repeat-containing protein [Kiritimatiellia bacterium]